MLYAAMGSGDPIFTGFAGRSFEFLGQPGHYYNVMSERNHQISTKLKVGIMWDHNGTYMEGIGFHYRSHKVVIELSATNPDTITGESAPPVAQKILVRHFVCTRPLGGLSVCCLQAPICAIDCL